MRLLTDDGQSKKWSGALSRDWMVMFPETAVVLYIDGHVRVYRGSQTELPRHYVAWQQLCLRATTDYWVNAMDGQPFFMVNRPVDPGLLTVLEEEIVPRLERELPLQADLCGSTEPRKPRFTVVFDREGYSPDFMARMLAKGIACLSYHKYPGDDWPAAEFSPRTVKLVSGQDEEMLLAECNTLLGKKNQGARDPQTQPMRSSDGNHFNRFHAGDHPLRCCHVRSLVPGKLFQIHARTLQSRWPGRLKHR